VKRDGSVACWGFDVRRQATPPKGEFASVSAGYEHACGVSTDGSVACWGRDQWGQSTPPQ
jgi:alpha-tubulin suppressor-like RCC1 family protein